MEYHPGTGKTHDLPYSVPHLRFVAVNSATGTEGLVFHKWALVTSLAGIFCQGRTLRTETGFRAMPFFTVKTNHQSDDCFFIFTFLINVFCHQFQPLFGLMSILQQ